MTTSDKLIKLFQEVELGDNAIILNNQDLIKDFAGYLVNTNKFEQFFMEAFPEVSIDKTNFMDFCKYVVQMQSSTVELSNNEPPTNLPSRTVATTTTTTVSTSSPKKSKTPRVAKNKGKAWSEPHIKKLSTSIANGYSPEEIARVLNRSTAAVVSKAISKYNKSYIDGVWVQTTKHNKGG